MNQFQKTNIITRFAPSPTGYLHIGGARTALFNWIFARKSKGKFLLRIEDTDKSRLNKDALSAIFDGLKWLGIKWDNEVIYQSKRNKNYQDVISKLLENKLAYKCYSTQNEINNYSKISLIGHSYGGIVLAKLLEKDYSKNIEFHIVASGISGDPRLNSFCGYRPPKQTGENVVAYQWMTQKHLDGAFKDLDIDTQIQKIEGVSAVRLPEVYKDNTLTHNWSISWLVDYLNKK